LGACAPNQHVIPSKPEDCEIIRRASWVSIRPEPGFMLAFMAAKIVIMGESQLKQWMGWLKEELLALVTDNDTYWRLQEEVIYRNHRLLTMRSPYFDMLHYAYVSTTTSAIRRLTEKQNKDKTNVSLRIVLEEIEKDPVLFENQVPRPQLQSDLDILEGLEKVIKPYVDRMIAHHDRRGIAETPKYGNLRASVAALGDIFRRYYALIEGVDSCLKIDYLEDFDIFKFPWIENQNKSFV
jgi:hypothetical protein